MDNVLRRKMLQPSIISSTGVTTAINIPKAPQAPKAPSTLPLSFSSTETPPPAPTTKTIALPLPPLPQSTNKTTKIDHHKLANEHFVAKRYHEATEHYKLALETLDSNNNLCATLNSNLSATFLRLHRYQEATVAARAAVNIGTAVNIAATPKAYYRLMKGLEGQRLLPEAIAVGLRALDILDEMAANETNGIGIDNCSDSERVDKKDTASSTVATPSATPSATSSTLQSRTTILSLLEHLHAQTVGKTKTANDAALLSTSSSSLSSNSEQSNVTLEKQRLEKSEELSRRILGLGVYASINEDGKENNNVGPASETSRVSVVNRDSMDRGARIAHPDAFVSLNLKELQLKLKGYKLYFDTTTFQVSIGDFGDFGKIVNDTDPTKTNATNASIVVRKGDSMYTDMSPLIIRNQKNLKFDASGLDQAACLMFQALFAPNQRIDAATAPKAMQLFSTRVKHLFQFFSTIKDTDSTVGNPFDIQNRAVFNTFAQEMACTGMGSDRMACVRHYCGLQGNTSNNPLSIILRCLHCVRRALQPFQDPVDGSFGLALSVGCPIVAASHGMEATVGFQIEQSVDGHDVCQYVATKDLHKGDLLKCVWVGQL